MISLVHRGAQVISVSAVEAKQTLAYLGWSKYMLTKLDRMEQAVEEGPGEEFIIDTTTDRILSQIEAALWMSVNYPTGCRTSNIWYERISIRKEMRVRIFPTYVVFAFSKKIIPWLKEHLPWRKIVNLCATLDKRFPERVVGIYPSPLTITAFFRFLMGTISSMYAGRTAEEDRFISAAINEHIFDDVFNSDIDLIAFRATQEPLLARIAIERSVSPSWIMKYLGVTR
jgi:hypothetical protein